MPDLKAGLALVVFALAGMLGGVAEAKLTTPFQYVSSGVEIVNYELDSNDMVLALDVKVTDTKGSLELTLDRSLIDSTNNGKDDRFFVIADGDEVIYKETKTTQKSRTITFSVNPEVELVEIFGTQIKGITFTEYQPTTINQVSDLQKLQDDNNIMKEKNIKLADNIAQLKTENAALKKENEKLDGRIFELQNLVSAMDKKIKDLNSIVSEQVKTIFKWISHK